MKFVRFSTGSQTIRSGIIIDDQVFSLEDMVPGTSNNMCEVIANWDQLKEAIASNSQGQNGIALDDVTLEAPISRPGKILAIGLNYADHVEESGMETPKEQIWFSKHSNTINGPYSDIQMPKVSDRLDYEVEMVAVIGKKGRHISREDAQSYVFGYAVGNDVSVRDWQLITPQWVLGKSFDSHCPFGPSIVTADEVGDPHTLGIRCSVNGEIRQNSNTKNLIFNLWDQIAHLSKAMTLEPGDIILTGTPGGVGFGFKPPKPLMVGDVIRCEIDKLGAIENKVAAEV